MTLDLALVLLMLAAWIVMFVVARSRMDAVALPVIVTMPIAGMIPVAEAIAGFSDPVTVLLAALFALAEEQARSGVARQFGDWP